MQIGLEKWKSERIVARISNDKQAVMLVPDLTPEDAAGEASGICINVTGSSKLATEPQESAKLENDKFYIARPGEYELAEVFISAQLNYPEGGDFQPTLSDQLDLIEVEIDGVRVLYCGSDTPLNKKLLAQLGVIDVLLIRVGSDITQQVKTVSSVDPQVVIPMGLDKETVEKFKHELGTVFTPEKKFKAKAVDFAAEEYVLRGIELEL